MDYFEIDFLDVESAKSGDAITIRYEKDGLTYIHVVDGGYQQTGDAVVEHINKLYGNPAFIDHVVATHPDGDHLGGLRTVLASYDVGALWMLRPWVYANELIHHFATYNSVDALKRRLKEIYPNVAALEEIATERGIPIREPFQGSAIGAFKVLAPSKSMYLDLVVSSEKTPESVEKEQPAPADSLAKILVEALKKAVNLVAAPWGAETFSTEETSSENEMSVVQFGFLDGQKVLLTGDAGRKSLNLAADFAPQIGLQLPGIDKFQVPHHGSRRNVSTALLDRLLGERLPAMHAQGKFSAVISSAKADEHHPRKSVVRAMIHRGAKVATTEGQTVCVHSPNAPDRGWFAVTPLSYPEQQEE
jgi:beta-lactamase superfamily II metal-dependent hydrolase